MSAVDAIGGACPQPGRGPGTRCVGGLGLGASQRPLAFPPSAVYVQAAAAPCTPGSWLGRLHGYVAS